jgi:hypothetical protein
MALFTKADETDDHVGISAIRSFQRACLALRGKNYGVESLAYSIIGRKQLHPSALSLAGAVGPMQVMPATANSCKGKIGEDRGISVEAAGTEYQSGNETYTGSSDNTTAT